MPRHTTSPTATLPTTPLPPGWRWATLGEVAKSIKGKKPSVISTNKSPATDVPYLDIKALEKGIVENYTDGHKCTISSADDVVIVWDGARSGWVSKGQSGALGSTLAIIKSYDIGPDLLFRFLQSKFSYINTNTKGVGIPHVDPNILWAIPIPLPPLAEQQRIVARLEDKLARLDSAVARLQAAKARLHTYRQAVLHKAFTGGYTGGTDGWEWKTLGEIAEVFVGSTPKRNVSEYWGGTINWVSSGEVRFRPIGTTKEKITHKGLESISAKIHPKGTILIAMIGEGKTRGQVGILAEEATHNQNTAAIRPAELLKSGFIYYFLIMNYQKSRNEGSGNNQKALNKKRVQDFVIPIPGFSIQETILEIISTQLLRIDTLETTIDRALTRAEALRQSLLKQAFEGKLVPQIEGEASAPVQVQPIKAPTPTDLHAGILALTIQRHLENPKHLDKMGNVKGEKIAHLAEAMLGLDLGRQPVKDAAGPDDYNHLQKVEHRATKANWFRSVKKADGFKGYETLPSLERPIQRLQEYLSPEQWQQLNHLIDRLLPANKEQAEIPATVFAAWNNLLIEGKSPTDEEIVFAAREDWSRQKLDLDRDRFFRALEWLRQEGFVPRGKGKYVKDRPVADAMPKKRGRSKKNS